LEFDSSEKDTSQTIITKENDVAYLPEKMGNSEEGMVLEIPFWLNLVELRIT
jgi:hypothetical protein